MTPDPPEKQKTPVEKAGFIKLEYYRQRYPEPIPEPELDHLIKYVRRDGKNFLVPKRMVNGKPHGKVYIRMTPSRYMRFLYTKNIEYITRRKRAYDAAISRYKLEHRKLQTYGATSIRRGETHDSERTSLESRIEIMLHNWRLKYRNKGSSPSAKRALGKIKALQRKLARMKPQTSGELLTGTFNKYHFDVDKLNAAADKHAAGDRLVLRGVRKITKFTGHLVDLQKFYTEEIGFLEDQYVEPLTLRININRAYREPLKK